MTVEDYLRAQVPGYPFKAEVLENAALSPALATPTPFRAISLSDVVEDYVGDPEYAKSLKYATSTIYYSMAGAFSGGSRTEQVDDIRASVAGFIITQRDREYYRDKADTLRRALGADVEESPTESGGMCDGSRFIKRTPKCRDLWNL